MLKVTMTREPIWIEIAEGARIQFKPWSTQALAAGQSAAAAALTAGHSADVAGVAFTIAAARWAALDWEGVGDEAGGELELTADNLQALLEQSPEAYREVDGLYVVPALEKVAEKNG